MNARQRMLNTIAFNPVDRPFRWEAAGVWLATADRWINEGLPPEAAADLPKYFNYDTINWLPIGSWTHEPFFPKFKNKVLADEGKTLLITDHGVIKRVIKEDRNERMPQFIKYPVETLEDYISIIEPRFYHDNPVYFNEKWDASLKTYENRDFVLGMYIIGPFGHLRNLMGDENLMYAMYDDPELIHYIMEKWKTFYLGLLGRICRDVTPDIIMVWEDMCYKNGPLCSPASYREFLMEPLGEVASLAKQFGIPGFFVDNDGDCSLMIPLYLEIGANGFFPFECQSGMDIRKIREQYGKQFVIIGGIEKYALADEFSEDVMKREVFAKVVPMLKDGGFIPMLDHSAPPNISYTRFCSFLKYIRELPVKYANGEIDNCGASGGFA